MSLKILLAYFFVCVCCCRTGRMFDWLIDWAELLLRLADCWYYLSSFLHYHYSFYSIILVFRGYLIFIFLIDLLLFSWLIPFSLLALLALYHLLEVRPTKGSLIIRQFESTNPKSVSPCWFVREWECLIHVGLSVCSSFTVGWFNDWCVGLSLYCTLPRVGVEWYIPCLYLPYLSCSTVPCWILTVRRSSILPMSAKLEASTVLTVIG